MKKLIAFFTALIPFVLSAQNIVTIHGTIQGLKGGEKIYYRSRRARLPDSVTAKPGSFTIHISIAAGEGDEYRLYIGANNNNSNLYEFLYLDSGTVTITGNGPEFMHAKHTGTSASMKDLNNYERFLQGYASMKRMDTVSEKSNDLYAKGDTAGFNILEPEWQHLDSIRTVLSKQWISQHKSSPISAYIVYTELQYKLETDELEAVMNELTSKAKNNITAKQVLHKVEVEKVTGIGRQAIPLYITRYQR